jgi:hypothetical protein
MHADMRRIPGSHIAVIKRSRRLPPLAKKAKQKISPKRPSVLAMNRDVFMEKG